MYIDKKNMKKLSEVWENMTDIAYAKDMNKRRADLFKSLESFGAVLRQATADNETAKNRANDPDVEQEAYHEWLNTPDHGQD